MKKIKELINKLLSIQIIKSFLVGVFSTGTDVIVFTTLNIVLPENIKNTPFKLFGPFVYEPKIGGLATFIALTSAYIAGSIVSYIVQRKFVFKSNVDVKKSFTEFIISAILVYIFVTYAVEIITPFFVNIFGKTVGKYVGTYLSQFLAFLIHYCLNKNFILKKKEEKNA